MKQHVFRDVHRHHVRSLKGCSYERAEKSRDLPCRAFGTKEEDAAHCCSLCLHCIPFLIVITRPIQHAIPVFWGVVFIVSSHPMLQTWPCGYRMTWLVGRTGSKDTSINLHCWNNHTMKKVICISMTIYSPIIEEHNLLITGSWHPFVYCQARNIDFGTLD